MPVPVLVGVGVPVSAVTKGGHVPMPMGMPRVALGCHPVAVRDMRAGIDGEASRARFTRR
jgi:hypothetical protein